LGKCEQCADPTNCDGTPDPTPTPTPTPTPQTPIARSSSSNDDEEFEEGPVPFPFGSASFITSAFILLTKIAAPGAASIGMCNIGNSLYAVFAWCNLIGNYGTAKDDHDDRRRLYDWSAESDDRMATYAFGIIVAGVGLHYICNLVFFTIYCACVRQDLKFTRWRDQHNCTIMFTPTISLLASFHCFRLFICGACDLSACKAEFTNKRIFYLGLVRMTYFHMLFVLIPLVAAEICVMVYFEISNVIWMYALDALVVTILLLIGSFINTR
jgi:hypothetical protein